MEGKGWARGVLPVSRIAEQSSRNIISGTASGKIIPRMTPARSFFRIINTGHYSFQWDVHSRHFPLPEETDSVRMPGSPDAGRKP